MEAKQSNSRTVEQSNNYLLWLEWPEKCFRVDAEALRALKGLVPKGSRVLRTRSEAAFLRALPKATHAITWQFKAEWFAKAPKLKVLATPAAGQEFVPTKGPKGVKIHFGHYHGQIMSESVAAFVLAWAHGFFAVRQAPKSCKVWPRTWLSDKCTEVAGTRAVILGYGHVGRAIGAKLAALGVDVYGITRHGVYRQAEKRGGGGQRIIKIPLSTSTSSLDLFREADWLILALPSTTGTDNFLNAALLRKLPRKCVVINVGRGNAVDEKALCKALKTKRLAGAYLDVRKHEPSATVLEAPGYVKGLADLPNCIIMPHASAFSPRYLIHCFEELKDDGCL